MAGRYSPAAPDRKVLPGFHDGGCGASATRSTSA
jgi:hypothetical protein